MIRHNLPALPPPVRSPETGRAARFFRPFPVVLMITAAAAAAAMLVFQPRPVRAQAAEAEPLLQNLNIVEEGDRKVVEIALKDILLLALKRSNPLKVARISEEIAASRLAAARNRNHPTLTSKVQIGRSLTPFSAVVTGSDEVTVSSEISKKVSSGITYGLKFQETAADIAASDNYSSSLTGSVKIPIYQDYGTELDEVPVRQGELGIERSRLEIRRDTLQILRAVAVIYWDLVDLRAQVKVAEDSVSLSERLVDDNQRRVEAGVLSPADVAVVQALLARERQTLLEFQLAVLRVEDQVRAALNLEAFELGYRPTEEPALRETSFNFAVLAERMFANSPQLGILAAALESNNSDLLVARNKEKTDLDASLFYVFMGSDSSPLGGVSGFTDTDLGGYGAALTWTLPLFDRITGEQIQQRLLERAQLELRIKGERSNLTVRLQSVLRSLRLAGKEVETARIAQSLAEQLLKNEIERTRLGRGTSFQVAEFQQDAGAAQRREIAARVRYEKAFLEMLILTGDIFEFYELPDDA